MKKHKLAFFAALLCLFAFVVNAYAASYVGNAKSMKFHYTSCKWAKKISPNNRVELSDRESAINSGYVPCKVCKP